MILLKKWCEGIFSEENRQSALNHRANIGALSEYIKSFQISFSNQADVINSLGLPDIDRVGSWIDDILPAFSNREDTFQSLGKHAGYGPDYFSWNGVRVNLSFHFFYFFS